MDTTKKKLKASAYTVYGAGYKRKDLEGFIEKAGLRYFKDNKPVIDENKFSYVRECIREDLGISRDMRLEIRWYETGNAFSLAKDARGNNTVQIHLGSKNTIFETAFNKRTCKFIGLYYNREPVTISLLKSLL